MQNSKKSKLPFVIILVLLAFLVVMAGAGKLLWSELTDTTMTKLPTPYEFSADWMPNSAKQELQEAIKANIMIVGDRMAVTLGAYSDLLSKKLSEKLSSPLKVSTFAQEDWGLHRLLKALKTAPSLPRIIIYHGSSQELVEERFLLEHSEKILNNINSYQNPKMKTALYVSPSLSKVVYEKFDKYKIGSMIKETPEDLNDLLFQTRAEIHYKLYEIEFEELVKLIQEKGGNLIITNTPINLEVKPNKVCANASSNDLAKRLRKIAQDYIDKKDYKEAVNLLKKLNEQNPANSDINYLLGMAHKGNGDMKKAKYFLEMANAYDCQIDRSSIVFNSIVERLAKFYELPFMDFQGLVYNQWNTNVLFQDNLTPQGIYYQLAMEELSKLIAPLIF